MVPIRGRPDGQAIVETVLALPLILGLILGTAELAVVGVHQHLIQTAADNVAAVVAIAPPGAPYGVVEADEAARAGCDTFTGTLTWPDGGQAPGQRVAYALECTFVSLTTAAKVITATSTTVVPVTPEPSPAPSPEPTS